LAVELNTWSCLLEHVSYLAKYASHLDVRLGELESEQRLLQIRTERHLKSESLVWSFSCWGGCIPDASCAACLWLVEEVASKRVSFYGTLECVVYITICAFQVYYIKSLLDSPSKVRSWV
jgi:hypothetical protein